MFADRQPEAFGPYVVRARMGEGRFGTVYRAHDPAGNRPVVVRTFTQPFSPAERAGLVDELTRLCGTPLDHPSIARPLAAGIEDEHPFLVHTLLPGVPVDAFLAWHGPQPLSDVVLRVTQLAAAIDFAAAVGVHHGNLGSEDVILAPDGAGISGFGLTQAIHAAGGTSDRSPTRPDDVRSLAEIGFRLLTGRSWDQTSLDALTMAGADAARLRAAFEEALSTDPSARPATALAFAAALQGACEREASAPGAEAAPIEAPADTFAAPDTEAVTAVDLHSVAPLPDQQAHPGIAAAGAVGVADLPLRRQFDDTPRADVIREPAVPARADLHRAPAAVDLHGAPVEADLPIGLRTNDRPVAAPAMFATREAESTGGGWFVVAAALAVGLLGGFAAGFIVGQRGDPVVAPRSAAQAVRPTAPARDPDAATRDSRTGTTVDLPGDETRVAPPELRVSEPPAPAAPPAVTRPAVTPPALTPAATPAADAPGTMQVLSRPEGAEVFVDGARVGRTPLVIPTVRPGTHTVRMQLAGFQNWTTTVRVEAGSRARVAASLEQ